MSSFEKDFEELLNNLAQNEKKKKKFLNF